MNTDFVSSCYFTTFFTIKPQGTLMNIDLMSSEIATFFELFTKFFTVEPPGKLVIVF